MKTLAIAIEDACVQKNLQLKVYAKKRMKPCKENKYHTK
jgi:hypothetical protein